MSAYIREFKEIRKDEIALAGGKGANLGEMTAAGINIPKGAVLLADACDEYMAFNSIEVANYADSKEVRQAIIEGTIPSEIKEEITAYYQSMGKDDV